MPNFAQLDSLVHQAHFGSLEQQTEALIAIHQQAQTQGIFPASIHPLYRARAQGALPTNFTVPAFNLRGLSYLTAQAAFEAAIEQKVGLFIFELARSEMKYTFQTPLQVAASVLGAAIKSGWQGPVFLQGDHYQPKASAPGQIKEGEKESIQQLIHDSIAAGFYNIDIDGSTLVDTNQPTEYDQQRSNFLFTAQMIKYIATLQPFQMAGQKINIGCEIAEVGTHLSKSSQLAAFMTGLRDEGFIHEDDYPTKVAVETGTAHGGKVNRDGSAGEMLVDYERLQTISMIARRKYGMAGAVQHGASTLDKALMARFPQCETAEIHLSTGFQNTILDHPAFPQALIDAMYAWCDINCREEKKPDWTPAQFYVKARKKAWGPFKKQTWELPEANQLAIKLALKKECLEYFEGLGVKKTQKILAAYFPSCD